MPEIEVPVERARIVLRVAVSVPDRAGERHVDALLDTGADTSCISHQLADQLGAVQVGQRRLSGVGASHKPTPTFAVAVRVPAPQMTTAASPNHFKKEVLVAQIEHRPEGSLPATHCDVLIGMDLIACWHVEISSGRCVITW